MKYPFGSFIYAKDFLREGNYDMGIKVLYVIATSEFPDTGDAMCTCYLNFLVLLCDTNTLYIAVLGKIYLMVSDTVFHNMTLTG